MRRRNGGFLARWLPSREDVQGNRWLGWIRPLLARAHLWHFSRRGVARGAALGVFFGFLVPLAQIPLAALGAVFLRANLPVAMATTFITNPLTFAPIYFLAYRLGLVITGRNGEPLAEAAFEAGQPGFEGQAEVWLQRVAEVGLPLAAGLAVCAVTGAFLAHGLVSIAWRLHVARRLARRRLRRRV